MLNDITIAGRLVADPALHATRDGKEFVSFTIANARDYDREKTDFYDVLAFGNTASFINNWWMKGKEIMLQGHLQTSSWTDKNGAKRRDVKIIAERVYFCGKSAEKSKSDDVLDGFTEIPDEDIPFK